MGNDGEEGTRSQCHYERTSSATKRPRVRLLCAIRPPQIAAAMPSRLLQTSCTPYSGQLQPHTHHPCTCIPSWGCSQPRSHTHPHPP
jgi:hypothetical protein